jgi:hypothetical protein
MRLLLLALLSMALPGCSLIPEISHQPVVHNPFPQLSKVAVAPFFNLSTEPGVDGREFALAYFNELQLVPGFQVVPVGVVEQAIQTYGLAMSSPEDARKLAQILEVDAVVIGSVTDFSPYYPPRCAMRVEWYAANPCYHPIPPGYGLPWGTPEEEYIPEPLVFEAEMALAREQLKTQSPPFQPQVIAPLEQPASEPSNVDPNASPENSPEELPSGEPMARPLDGSIRVAHSEKAKTATTGKTAKSESQFPPGWPNARGFVPAGPCVGPPVCEGPEKVLPVLEHTKTYNGQDAEFTAALASFTSFQDDARFGGWQGHLQRSDDFIRFCCRMHVYELLSARGGADESRVVWRWSPDR